MLLSRFDDIVDRDHLHVLEIPDEYQLLDPELVELLEARAGVIPDRFLLDLFEHCSEEMNHLAKFLPALYRDVQAAASLEAGAIVS